MNRRPNRPFFCFLLDIDQQTHFFRPTGPWGVELPGWGPCTSHPTGRVACRGMPWEEMADMQKLIPRYSKHFPRTEWLSDCWFYWCLDFHRNGRMITTINKPHSFRVEGVREIRWDTAYICVFFGWWSELHQGGCQMSGHVGPWLKVLQNDRPPNISNLVGVLMLNSWGHIALILHHTGITTMKRQNQLHLINSRPACSSPESQKKTRKKGGMVDGFPMFPSLDGL